LGEHPAEQELITAAPLLALYSGLMIFQTVVACNLLGDALRHRLDPTTAGNATLGPLTSGTKKNRHAERGG
jgi:hypothetical protein